MRIRTQLFAGTATLVLALVGIQWWLQTRQVRALERELADVVTSVGQVLLLGPPGAAAGPLAPGASGFHYAWESRVPAPGPAGQGSSDTVLSRRLFVRRRTP